MSAEEQSAAGDPEIAAPNRIMKKVLAKEQPTAEEIAFLRDLRIEVRDLFQHSRRVD
jgi:hypothetical protein